MPRNSPSPAELGPATLGPARAEALTVVSRPHQATRRPTSTRTVSPSTTHRSNTVRFAAATSCAGAHCG